VIKDMGVGSFYRGQTAEAHIAHLHAQPHAPEIEYLNQALSEAELAGLYTACQCLVHPYRGEAFVLPLAEAMACGLPVLTTGYGPALDFCTGASAGLVPGRVVPFAQKQIGTEPTVDFPWLVEPDREVLQAWMQHMVAEPERARAMGEAGRQRIHGAFTWEHTVEAIEHRLAAWRHPQDGTLWDTHAEPPTADVAIVVSSPGRMGFLARPYEGDGLGSPSYQPLELLTKGDGAPRIQEPRPLLLGALSAKYVASGRCPASDLHRLHHRPE
jgi:hypothetical protein